MAREIRFWICDSCGRSHKTQRDAEDCEKIDNDPRYKGGWSVASSQEPADRTVPIITKILDAVKAVR